jgi:long-chain acyl-CoA synthetase
VAAREAGGLRALNFAALVAAQASRRGDRLAILGDAALSYAALDRRAAGAARALAERGVRAGDRVALVLANDWRFAVGLLAVWRLGATAAPLNPLLGRDDQRDILDDLSPRLVVDDVAVADGDGPIADATAPALILYTSGSTGRPKGAVLSHAATIAANQSWAEPVMRLTPDDVVLAALPLAHSFGLNGALLAPFYAGAAVAMVARFTPEATVEAIARHRVTVVPAVATMFRRLLDSAVLDRVALGSVRIALSGAAPCPWELAEEWRARTGVRILRGYGMTELFRPLSYLDGDPTDLPDAIGRPVPDVEIRLVDDAGADVPKGEVGELWIRTPCALDEYFGAPEATREVLVDGWFRTGDLATATPQGYISIVGRKRERILRAGYSVFPPEVERVLASHPAVAEAAVVGVAHAELGEEVAGFVALRPGAAATAPELIAWCRERLAAYKYPRSVAILDRLPRNATDKIAKSELVTKR